MSKTVGVTVGKFMPMHKGHELMIEMAASQLDEMVVIVSSMAASTPGRDWLNTRYEIIKQKYANVPNITVVKYVDTYSELDEYLETDDNGTVINNEPFWDYWTNIFRTFAPDATHFVSSDRYGKEAARRMDIEWFAVDPDRELFDISATQIRNDPVANWKYLAREFRPHYVKKVVVVGPESSGKSTLVKDLGKAWNSPAVPEYGRIMTEIVGDNEWKVDDFHLIVTRQHAMNDKAALESETGVIFIDTEAYTTFLYCVEYLDGFSRTIKDMAYDEKFDLVVLVKPNLPWVNDGARVMPKQNDRQTFYDTLLQFISCKSDDYYELDETDRTKRVTEVSVLVADLLAYRTNKFKNVVDNLTTISR